MLHPGKARAARMGSATATEGAVGRLLLLAKWTCWKLVLHITECKAKGVTRVRRHIEETRRSERPETEKKVEHDVKHGPRRVSR